MVGVALSRKLMRKLSITGIEVNDLLSGKKVCVTHRPTVHYSSLSPLYSLLPLSPPFLSSPPPYPSPNSFETVKVSTYSKDELNVCT